jgi:hypothetical protein
VRASSLLEHGFQTYDWKALFPSPSIDSLPMADDAKGPITIRKTVISWVCGTARRAVAKLNGKKAVAGGQGGETLAKPAKTGRKPETKAMTEAASRWQPW